MASKPMSIPALVLIMGLLTLGLPGLGTSPAHAAPEDAALFQEALAGLGQWLTYGQYGQVWRPGRVDRDWRPYTNGRWVPTENGYIFETDEPWGWATYHYGNWLPTNEHGWVWIPGRTWYPHTVTWRTSDEHVGWAPVPPSDFSGSDNYYPDNYAGGGYAPTSGQYGYGSAYSRILPQYWIFTQAADFLQGWGMPYYPAYSYARAGVLASSRYSPTIYARTVYVTNYVYPSYAPRACYNWGPPVTYITRVTKVKNINVNRPGKHCHPAQLRNALPPPHLKHKHPAWREVWPVAVESQQVHVRPASYHRGERVRLNRPDAIPAPAARHQQPAERLSPNADCGDNRPARQPIPGPPPHVNQPPGPMVQPPDRSRPPGNFQMVPPPERASVIGPPAGPPAEAERRRMRQEARGSSPPPLAAPGPPPEARNQPPIFTPPQRQLPPDRRVQGDEGQAPLENPRLRQGRRVAPDPPGADPEQIGRQQQRLEAARQQHQARIHLEQEQQQARQQQQMQEEQRRQAEMARQQRRQQEMPRQPHLRPPRQAVAVHPPPPMQPPPPMVRQAPPPAQPRQGPPPQRQKRQNNPDQPQ
ncbi:MAG: hypothetical protein FJ135_16390 [Deltaproteobacteria bacterium]|nr:hypothetical protein [Deltaproteobacteria bacterium]